MNTRAPTNPHRPVISTLENSVPDDELKITSKAATTTLVSPDAVASFKNTPDSSSFQDGSSSQGSLSTGGDWSRDSSSRNGHVAGGKRKKKLQDRPWKPARQYDAVLTDSVDVCGVNPHVISPVKTPAVGIRNASGKNRAGGSHYDHLENNDDDDDDDDNVSEVSSLNDHDKNLDDDVSYDESESKDREKEETLMDDADVDPTLSSRWSKQQPVSAEEIKLAHEKGIGLAVSRADRRRRDPREHLADLSLSPMGKEQEMKKKNHEQVRMEALKLLELANSTGESGQYMIKETYSNEAGGGSNFKSMRVKGLDRSSALSGLGLGAFKERRQKGTYDRMEMEMENDLDDLAQNGAGALRLPCR